MKTSNMKKMNIPNVITSVRIVGAVVLIFLKTLSIPFLLFYTILGFTDVLDGYIARKTGNVTELGSKLDSIADVLFYTVMLIKVLPILVAKLPNEIWYVVAGILVLRVCSYTVAAVKFRRFTSMHTYLNKMTGLSVFAVPYLIHLSIMVILCWGVCIMAALATVEELAMHLIQKEYSADKKSMYAIVGNKMEASK